MAGPSTSTNSKNEQDRVFSHHWRESLAAVLRELDLPKVAAIVDRRTNETTNRTGGNVLARWIPHGQSSNQGNGAAAAAEWHAAFEHTPAHLRFSHDLRPRRPVVFDVDRAAYWPRWELVTPESSLLYYRRFVERHCPPQPEGPASPKFPKTLRPRGEIETGLDAAALTISRDDLPRWVEADLLDEQCIEALSAYAAFVRYQLYNGERVLHADSPGELHAVEREFFYTHLGTIYGISDAAALDVFRKSVSFRRGGMFGLVLTDPGLAALLPELAEREPLTYLEIARPCNRSFPESTPSRLPLLRCLKLSGEVDFAYQLVSNDVSPALQTLVLNDLGTCDGEDLMTVLSERNGPPLRLLLSKVLLDFGNVRMLTETRLPIRELWTGIEVDCYPPRDGEIYPFTPNANDLEVLVTESDQLNDFNASQWIASVTEGRKLRVVAAPTISVPSLLALLDYDKFPLIQSIYADIVEFPEAREDGSLPAVLTPRVLGKREVVELVQNSGRAVAIRPFRDLPRPDLVVSI